LILLGVRQFAGSLCYTPGRTTSGRRREKEEEEEMEKKGALGAH
jgi:hypothetical protein